MVKDRLVLALLAVLDVMVFLTDHYLVPDTILPAAAYAIPIFIAAWVLPPRSVAAISVWAALLEFTSAWMQRPPLWPFSTYAIGITIFGVLGTALSARIKRESALALDAARRAAELEEVAKENARLHQQTQFEQARWRATVESMLDPVTVGDSQGHAVYMNPAYTRMVGMTIKEGLPLEEHSVHYQLYRPDGTLYQPEDLPLQRAALRDEDLHNVEIIEGTAWEDRRITVWNASPLHDEGGQVIGSVAVGRDVTGERRLEADREKLLETLRESNRQLTEANRTCAAMAQIAERRLAERQSVLDNMADAVLVADIDGRIIMANQAAATMLGLDRPEDTRTSIDGVNESHRVRMADGQPRPKHTHPLARALSGETVTLEDSIVRNPKTGKDVYLRSNAAPMRDERGQIVGAVSVGRDVTELTELERLKEELISVTAHELKTPVTIMKGFAQTLLHKADNLSPEQRKILDYIDRGANRIDSVVQEMLDLSLLTTGGFRVTRERIDLTGFVEQMVDRMALSNPGHQLRLTRADRVSVHADMRRLAQVLDNLLDNAIRYSPAGGLVQVEVRAEGDQAEVAVSDHGIGIPSGKQARIFQRLYRAHTGTHYDYGGIGVGLYLSREIVRCHGGDMDFESVEGVGSTFRFSLPVGESDSDPSPGVSPQ